MPVWSLDRLLNELFHCLLVSYYCASGSTLFPLLNSALSNIAKEPLTVSAYTPFYRSPHSSAVNGMYTATRTHPAHAARAECMLSRNEWLAPLHRLGSLFRWKAVTARTRRAVLLNNLSSQLPDAVG